MARRAAGRAGSSIRAPRSTATSTGSRPTRRRAAASGGIALTHGHADHTDGVAGLLARVGRRPRRPRPRGRARPCGSPTGTRSGRCSAIATPGHAPDHLAFLAGRALFTRRRRARARQRLRRARPRGAARLPRGARPAARARPRRDLPRSRAARRRSPRAKLAEYRDHRLDRERRLVAALDDGLRTPDELLDRVWSDVPSVLRPAAAVTLAAHLDKLAGGGAPAGGRGPRRAAAIRCRLNADAPVRFARSRPRDSGVTPSWPSRRRSRSAASARPTAAWWRRSTTGWSRSCGRTRTIR